MPYDVPTAAQLKDRFARFVLVADARVSTAIVEAAGEVPVTWKVTDYQPGILYLAAHLLVIGGALASSGVTLTADEKIAAASEIAVGDVRVKFGAGAGSLAVGARAGYQSTVYGQRFEELRARNSPSPYSYPVQRA